MSRVIAVLFLFSSVLLGVGFAARPVPISSNSVLVALLDSQYTELGELVEKAMLLQALEDVVGTTNVTIFAPTNAAIERQLDPEFKRFLNEPGNLGALQRLIKYHIVPRRIAAGPWTNATHRTLSKDTLTVSLSRVTPIVDASAVTHVDSVVRPDGVIHGIEKVLVPQSVQDDFNRWRGFGRRASLAAIMPEGAPIPTNTRAISSAKKNAYVPKKPIFDAMAPGPSVAPAPAPGPGTGHHHFDGERQVKDFINTLVLYGGYNEMADILVNLTSLATELGKLVSEGYRVTILAPNDEAMSQLTTDQLSQPGAPEQIVYYHIIPEYQTEESMYNAVRRFGKVQYETLHVPHKITAEEADGTVLFERGGHLLDHDIYVDGRISVQGIDKVLLPPSPKSTPTSHTESTSRGRKLGEDEPLTVQSDAVGGLQGIACKLFGRVGVTSCR